MVPSGKRNWATPRDNNLGLYRIENRAGLSINVLPNGCIFAIEHRREDGTTMINQLLGSPVDGGIARLYLRIGGAAPISVVAAGPGATGRFGAAGEGFVWEGETSRTPPPRNPLAASAGHHLAVVLGSDEYWRSCPDH